MRLFALHTAAALIAAAILLSACSANSQLASTPPQYSGSSAQISGIGPGMGKKSWMDHSAKSEKLLYISDFASKAVDIYTYPYLRLAGVLTGFTVVQGECTDPSGYVWITDQAQGKVFEYAHGGTTPVNVLTAPAPISCATSPTSGDLAVSDNAAGQIEIYHNAAGSGTVVADSNIFAMNFLGYDKAGNLFVDGIDSIGNFKYAELPSGGSSFTDITLSQTPAYPGNIQWDGTYIAIGDFGDKIYETQGSTVVNTITLDSNCVRQFYIFGGQSKRRVIAPDVCDSNANIFAYPSGGSPLKTVTGGLLEPIGAVLSK